jgi:transcriptional regulator with XRE-family HTH domain
MTVAIRKYRKKALLSQEELGALLEVSQAAVSQWETGASEPKIELLKTMAQIFGCTIDDLLKEEPQI